MQDYPQLAPVTSETPEQCLWDAVRAEAELKRDDFKKIVSAAKDKLNVQDKKTGMTPLSEAIQNGHVESVKILLNAGADPTTPDKKGMTPLMYAAIHTNPKMVEVFFDQGSETHQKVYSAAINGQGDVLDFLLASTSDKSIDEPCHLSADGKRISHLEKACQEGRFIGVQFLISRGADTKPLNVQALPLKISSSVFLMQGIAEKNLELIEMGLNADLRITIEHIKYAIKTIEAPINIQSLDNALSFLIRNCWTEEARASSAYRNGMTIIVDGLKEKNIPLAELSNVKKLASQIIAPDNKIRSVTQSSSSVPLPSAPPIQSKPSTIPFRLGLLTTFRWGSIETNAYKKLWNAVQTDQDSPKEFDQWVAEAKAKINIPDPETGMTLLSLAVQNGQVESVKKLLKAGVNANLADTTDMTPLMYASRQNKVEMVNVFFDKKFSGQINFDLQNMQDETAFMLAAKNPEPEIFDVFFTAFQSKYSKLKSIIRPLVESENIERLENLQRGLNAASSVSGDPKINIQISGTTLLSLAVQENRPLSVEKLLETGVDPNVADAKGMTPLMHVAKANNPEIVQVFLDAKPAVPVKLDPVNHQSENAFVLAARNETPKIYDAFHKKYSSDSLFLKSIIPVFLDSNNDARLEKLSNELRDAKLINTQGTQTGTTLLSWAVKKGDVAKVKQLLAAGADPNIPDSSGTTPFMYASQQNIEMVNAFLLGPMPLSFSQQNSARDTAFTLAAKNPVPEIYDAFHEKLRLDPSCYFPPYLDSVVPVFLDSKNNARMKNLLTEVLEVKRKSGDFPRGDIRGIQTGVTLLSWAVQNGHHERVEELLKVHPASANVADGETGMTPLMHAVEKDDAKMVDVFFDLDSNVRKQIDFHKANNKGETAFMLSAKKRLEIFQRFAAKFGSEHSKLEKVILILLTSGDHEKLSTLRINLSEMKKVLLGNFLFNAAKKGDAEIVQFLIDGGIRSHILGGNPNELTALCVAAKYGHLNVVRVLLDSNHLFTPDANGCYLHAQESSQSRNAGSAELDPSEERSTHYAPLLWIWTRGVHREGWGFEKEAIFKLVGVKDDKNTCPSTVTKRGGDLQVYVSGLGGLTWINSHVYHFLKHNWSPEHQQMFMRDVQGEIYALREAAANGHTEVVAELCKRNPHLKSYQNLLNPSPIEQAIQNDHFSTFKVLWDDKTNPIPIELIRAAAIHSCSIFDFYFDKLGMNITGLLDGLLIDAYKTGSYVGVQHLIFKCAHPKALWRQAGIVASKNANECKQSLDLMHGIQNKDKRTIERTLEAVNGAVGDSKKPKLQISPKHIQYAINTIPKPAEFNDKFYASLDDTLVCLIDCCWPANSIDETNAKMIVAGLKGKDISDEEVRTKLPNVSKKILPFVAQPVHTSDEKNEKDPSSGQAQTSEGGNESIPVGPSLAPLSVNPDPKGIVSSDQKKSRPLLLLQAVQNNEMDAVQNVLQGEEGAENEQINWVGVSEFNQARDLAVAKNYVEIIRLLDDASAPHVELQEVPREHDEPSEVPGAGIEPQAVPAADFDEDDEFPEAPGVGVEPQGGQGRRVELPEIKLSSIPHLCILGAEVALRQQKKKGDLVQKQERGRAYTS